jgi:hypothetical protein
MIEFKENPRKNSKPSEKIKKRESSASKLVIFYNFVFIKID